MGTFPLFEKLEDRILLTAEPTVAVDGPSQVELGAQDVTFTVSFDNTSGDATPDNPDDGDVGFSPFINVVLPTTGSDGDDGVTFDEATFLGTPITPVQLVFDDAGQAEHPLAVDANGDPIVITGTPGDTLLVFPLPYGSFSPNQVPVEIELTLDFSPLADLDDDLTIEAVGGFALGGDPLDNPDADPSILGAPAAPAVVTPELLTLTKTNDGPESETATGPNFPRTWVIDVDVADGQTLTDVVIQDLLPSNVHYLGNLQITGGVGTPNVLIEPAVDAIVQPDDRTLQIGFDTLDGLNPVQITFDYFIPETDASGGNVLDPSTGDDGAAVNDVSATADWTPLDPRDAPLEIVSDASAVDDTLDLRSIAVQKSFVISDDLNVAGPTPGDTVTYALDLQISDFFTMGDIVLNDVLGDGLEFLPGTVNFSVIEANGTTIPVQAFAAGAVAQTGNSPGTGQTTVQFNLSQAMQAAGGDGILVGDLVDGAQEQGTTARITYDALIKEDFDNPIDRLEISQGDELRNDVTVSATVRDNANPGAVLDTEEDTSSASFNIPFGAIQQKSIVAINGAAPTADLLISAGDEVTFSVIYTAPIGAFEDLTLDDFLPLPVFDSTEVTTFTDGSFAGIPAAGTASFGAATSATYFDEGGTSPTLSTNANSNALTFNFGDFTVAPREQITLEVLFTTTVVDAVFADGLLLTNQASIAEENTSDAPEITTAITQFNYAQPELEITKGVIASSAGTLSAAAGPVAFTDPGTTGQRAQGVVSSDGLDTTPIDADLADVDAGDLVSFAIIVENTGSSPDGVFNVQIQDTPRDGFVIPAGGLNLDVRDGAGNSLAFIDLGGGLFGSGIELVDDPDAGSLTAFDGTSGTNLVIVTYDLELAESAGPAELVENTASVAKFSAFEDGINRVVAPLEDNASVTTLAPSVDKRILTTSEGDDTDVTLLIGETVTYELVIDLTEGTTEDVRLIDRTRFSNFANDPDGGALEIVSAEIAAIGANLTLENAFNVGDGPTIAPFDDNGDGINDRLEYDFGTVVNAPDNSADENDQIVVHVTALVSADEATQGGDQLRNLAVFLYEDERDEDLQVIRVRESNVSIDKSVDPLIADAGDEVTYRIEVTNDELIVAGRDRSASAFDLVLTDVVADPDLQFVAGSVVLSGAAGGDANLISGNGAADTGIEITLDELATNDSLIIEYRAVVTDDAPLGDILFNTADLTYDSLPGDDAPTERDYSISDDAELALRAPELSKSVVSTSFAETDGVELAIGEEVTFQIVASIPEGTAPIVISDVLPTENGTLTFLSATVVDIGDDLIATSALAVGATATPTAGVVAFDFGTLANAPDGDDAEEQIVIEVVARVDDLPENAGGDTLTNQAQIQFSDDPLDVVTASADVDVVEPSLSIDKVAPAGPADAGDVLEFTLNVTNSGSAPAFDLAISDLLDDAGLVLETGSVTAAGFTTDVTETADGFTLETDRLDAGATLSINYRAVVQESVLFNSSLTNTATIERFDTNPDPDPAAPGRATIFDPANPDPNLTDSAEVSTPSVLLSKVTSESSTDDGLTGSDQFGGFVDVGVGETVTYTLTVTVPEGRGLVVLRDTLPDGLQALSAEVLSLGGTTSTNLAAGDTDATSAAITLSAAGDAVEVDFGELVSAGLDDAGGEMNREVQVAILAEVVDVAAAVAGAQLTNTATVQVFDPDDPGTELTDPAAPITASETVEVVEPSLAIDKAAPIAAGQGSTVSYTVTVTHDADSSGPAYDLVITDVLADPNLDFDSGSVAIAGSPDAVVTDVGTGFEVRVPVLDLGQSLTITYTATLAADAPPAESFPNTAALVYDSDPGPGGREQAAEDAARVSTVPVIDKVLDRTSFAETEGDALGLGEVATYRFEIFLPEVLNENLVVVDTLPEGLVAVAGGVRVLSVGADLSPGPGSAVADLTAPDVTIAGQEVRISFGDVDNAFDGDVDAGDRIVLEVDAAVAADADLNTDGEVLENSVALSLTAGNAELTDDDTAQITVVVPELSLAKTAQPTSGADAGDVITFTLEIANAGTGPAYDIVIEDLMVDAGLSLVPGSVTASDGAAAVEVANADATLGFTLTSEVLDAGQGLAITYQAVITDAAAFNGQVENTARVASFDTNPAEPGDPGFAGEVTIEADPNDPNDPLTDRANVTLDGVALAKTSLEAETGAPETASDQFDPALVDVTIGETVTYRLTVDLPEGSGIIVLTDRLPEGLQAVAAEVTALPPGVVAENLGLGDTDASAFLTISAAGDEVVAEFGLVTSTGIDDAGAETSRQIEIAITAVATDDTTNVAGAALTNTATVQVFDPNDPQTELTDTQNPTTATNTIEIVEPRLLIEKVAPVAALPGGTVTYALTVTHADTSTAAAFDVLISDQLANPNLVFDTGSVVISGANEASVVETSAGFDVSIPVLQLGEQATITYTATLAEDAPSASSFPNIADLVWDSAAGDGGRPGDDSDLALVATVPAIQKTLERTSFAETEGSELGLGEVATYRFEIVLPEVDTSNVVLTDALPEGLTPLAVRVVEIGGQLAGQGLVTNLAEPIVDIAGQVVTINFDTVSNDPDGILDDADRLVIELDAVLDADPDANPDGSVRVNTGTLTADVDGVAFAVSDDATISTVLPELSLLKQVDLPEGDAGDIVTFTLEIASSGTGPAYDVVIEDLMQGSGFSLISGSVVASDGTLATEITAPDGAIGFSLNVPTLDDGATLSVTYRAEITEAAEFNSTLTNTAQIARFDTNPGQPGDDDFTGEAVFGPDPNNPADPLVDSAEVSTPSVLLSKVTSESSTDDGLTGSDQFGGFVDVGVGETVTYTLTVTVPEGRGLVVLRDTLPDGLQALSAEVLSLGGTTSTNLAAGDTDATSAAITLSAAGDAVEVDFGELVSAGLDDAGGEMNREVQVAILAEVVDVAAAVAGAQLTNTATVQVFDPDDPGTELTDPAAPITASETVEVVEPSLAIDKAAPIAAGQGSTVSYTVTVTHDADSSGPAYDLVITDVLADPNLDFDSGSVAIAGSPDAVVTDVGTGFEVRVPVLDLGQSLTITYTATLAADAPPAESFPNTAALVYDSDPGPGGREQAAEDAARVSTVPVIDKVLDRTSFAETEGDALGLGEVATYRFEIFLPEVLNENLVVVDTLPEGLVAVAGGVRVLSVGADLSPGPGSAVADLTAPDVTIAGQEVRISFGDVDNAFDGDVDAGDRIVLEVDAAVAADADLNTDGEVLENSVALSLTAGNAELTDDDTAQITVVVPELSLAKTAQPTSGADAGDVITFTLEIANAGTGPAYDIVIEDLMVDAGLSLVPGSVTASDGAAAVEVANADATLGFTLTSEVLDAGQGLAITYQAVITDAAAFNGQVENTARVASFDTNPAEPGDPGFAGEVTIEADPTDPNDPLTDRANVTLDGVALAKTSLEAETGAPETASDQFDPALVDVTIGETVTYRLTVDLPEGSGIIVLTDRLPEGLQAVAAEVTALPPGVVAENLGLGDTDASAFLTISATGDEVVAEFGLVTSTGIDDAGAETSRQIEIAITAVATDDTTNVAGAALTNTATVQVFDPNDPQTELTDTQNPTTATNTIEIVEPRLELQKTTTATGPVDAGDVLDFTLAIQNSGTGPAFDINVVDQLLDAGLSLVAGSVVVSDGSAVQQVPNPDGTLGFTVETAVLAPAGTLTITYQALVTDSVVFGSDVANQAQITSYDTSPLEPGDPGFVGERTFVPDPTNPDDPLTSETATPLASPEFSKSVLATSVAETSDAAFDPDVPDLAIGETVTYRFAVTLPEGSADIVISDQFPTDSEFALLDVAVTAGDNFSGARLDAPNVVFTDTDADGVNDLLTLNLGDITNTPNNFANASDTFFVDVVVQVLDAPANAAGDSFTNVATLDFGNGTLTDTATVEIVEPLINVAKSVNNPAPFLGDTITYTIVLENDAAASGPAFDLVIDDQLPQGLFFTGNVFLSNPGLASISDGGEAGDTTLSVSVPVLQPGEVLIVNYDVQVDILSPVLSTLVNSATLSGGSVAGGDDADPDGPQGPLPPGAGGGDVIRQINGGATVGIEATPITGGRAEFSLGLRPLDEPDFVPFVRIDPIYSGSAEFGANLALTVFDQQGGFVSAREVLADAAGQWIATFPLLDTGSADRNFDQFFERSNLFESTTGILQEGFDSGLLGLGTDARDIRIGTFLTDNLYRLQIEESAASTGGDSQFNTRLYYAPAMNHEVFVFDEFLDVSDAFEDLADLTVERLLNASLNPLASGVNRFNAEFLAGSATPGGS